MSVVSFARGSVGVGRQVRRLPVTPPSLLSFDGGCSNVAVGCDSSFSIDCIVGSKPILNKTLTTGILPSLRRIHHARNKRYHPSKFCTLRVARFSTTTTDDVEDDEPNDGLENMTNLSPSMQQRIRTMKARHDEVLKLLHEGGDPSTLGKELSSLSAISTLCDQATQIHAEKESLLELLQETKSTNDAESKEMREEIEEELSQLKEQLEPLSQKMLLSLVPVLNPDDLQDLTSSDAVIDIRAGTGGDEACLFASEILACYEATAKAGGADESGNGGKSWDLEFLSLSRTDLGGIKEASLVVSSRGGAGGGGGYVGGYDNFDSSDGEGSSADQILKQLGPYGFFQYESGVHRVQRVPVNDNKLQTSAVSVAVLPSVPDSLIAEALPPTELKIETMRASGAGGQHVNTTESAVRVTHIPTGIMAYMQEERSQHKNKAKALKLVASRVYALRKEQERKNRSAARSSLMGGGDRSERIRTYNFPQDRITDHRCKVSVQGVQSWLGGGMVRMFGPHLYEMERDERVEALEEEGEEDQKSGDSGGKGSRKGKSWKQC